MSTKSVTFLFSLYMSTKSVDRRNQQLLHYLYMIYFFASLFFSLFLTLLIRSLALRFQVVDRPDHLRKRHAVSVPLLGGFAIFISFWTITLGLLFFHPLQGLELLRTPLLAAFVSSLLLMVVGGLDDLYQLSSTTRLILIVALVALAIALGIRLEKISNPAGGIIYLSSFIGLALVFLWLIGITLTVKILDGLDGLAAGVVTIAAVMIFLLTNTPRFFQPNVGLVSLIFAGSCLGFLALNVPPAKIVLGEAGGLLIGFMLGVLAIISGGKVATALIVMAIPALDLARVIWVRSCQGKSIFKGDRLHLHYVLVDHGWSVRQVVALFYCLAAFFGLTALFLATGGKLILLSIMIMLMVCFEWWRARA